MKDWFARASVRVVLCSGIPRLAERDEEADAPSLASAVSKVFSLKDPPFGLVFNILLERTNRSRQLCKGWWETKPLCSK